MKNFKILLFNIFILIFISVGIRDIAMFASENLQSYEYPLIFTWSYDEGFKLKYPPTLVSLDPGNNVETSGEESSVIQSSSAIDGTKKIQNSIKQQK